jgi:D-glycero-D-manno-heptose 1,7-bisphosphate phosphatase
VDRDGVINRAIVRNRKHCPLTNLAEIKMLPGVDTTIDRLKADRFKIIVVTNQPDVAAGVQKLSVVDEIHESLHASLGIDNISACYHVGADNYDCRTPKPGGLVPAAEKHNIGLSRSFLVGD